QSIPPHHISTHSRLNPRPTTDLHPLSLHDALPIYGGTSAVFNYDGAWLLIVTPGGETPDKPGTEFVPPPNPSKISHSMTNSVPGDRKSTRLNSSHQIISYAVFCLRKKK